MHTLACEEHLDVLWKPFPSLSTWPWRALAISPLPCSSLGGPLSPVLETSLFQYFYGISHLLS